MQKRENKVQSFWTAQQIQGARPYQEDFFAVVENNAVFYQGQKYPLEENTFPSQQTLYLLTDGMGGMGHGDVAAAQVTENFIEHYLQQLGQDSSIPEKLNAALHISNNLLADVVRQQPEYQGMGCTLIAVIWDRRTRSIHWLSIGDSPLWLYRDGQLQRLNVKHTWGEFAKTHKEQVEDLDGVSFASIADVLISAVDGQELVHMDLPTEPYPMQSGDLLLLASDGMETLSCGQIERQLATMNLGKKDSQSIFNALSEQRAALIRAVEAENDPHQDNASLILGIFIDEQ